MEWQRDFEHFSIVYGINLQKSKSVNHVGNPAICAVWTLLNCHGLKLYLDRSFPSVFSLEILQIIVGFFLYLQMIFPRCSHDFPTKSSHL